MRSFCFERNCKVRVFILNNVPLSLSQEQYVFLHQAVMEALVCGNTQVFPQDLMIRMTKLARVHKSSKKTGYAEEFKVKLGHKLFNED